MLQRGRLSRANRLTLLVDVDHRQLDPPSWLSRAERELFSELVNASGPRHFTASDLPLLVSYVQATLLARASIKRAGKDKDALLRWERAARMQAVLATKLQLAPQSRLDRKTVTRNLPPPGPRPWEV